MRSLGLKPSLRTTEIQQQLEDIAQAEMEREQSSRPEVPVGPWINGMLYDEEQQKQARVRLEIALLKHQVEQRKQAEVREQLHQERCRVYGPAKAEDMERRERAIARIRGEE